MPSCPKCGAALSIGEVRCTACGAGCASREGRHHKRRVVQLYNS